MTRLRTRLRRDDEGFTLAELLVSMGILSVVMLLVTGAVMLASGTSARVDAAAASQQQTHQAFDALDRNVRWAAAVSDPGTVNGDAYVEWLYTAAGAPTCNELRLTTGTRQLQVRSWPQGRTSSVTPWRVIASGVSAKTPFVTSTDRSGTAPQTLRVVVSATTGGAKGRDTSTHDVTYTALNSRGVTAPTTSCNEGRTLS